MSVTEVSQVRDRAANPIALEQRRQRHRATDGCQPLLVGEVSHINDRGVSVYLGIDGRQLCAGQEWRRAPASALAAAAILHDLW